MTRSRPRHLSLITQEDIAGGELIWQMVQDALRDRERQARQDDTPPSEDCQHE